MKLMSRHKTLSDIREFVLNNAAHILFVLCVFCFVAYRAAVLDFTYDETWTLISFVSLDVPDIFFGTAPNANNHFLNTLLVKLIAWPNYYSEFLTRLPNVLASLLYLGYAVVIAKRYMSGFTGWIFLFMMVFNPFLLDFFSLCRGYGLSFAFLIASTFYTLRFHETKKGMYANASMAFSVLAVLSSLSTILWCGATMAVLTFTAVTVKNKSLARSIISGAVLYSLILFTLIAPALAILVPKGGFWYGGSSGFYSDTLLSLTSYSMGKTQASELHVTVLNIVSAICLITISAGFSRARGLTEKIKQRNALLLSLIAAPALGTFVLHYLAGVKFPLDRTALFFYPLMVVLLAILVGAVENQRLKKLVTALLCVCAVLLTLNFYQQMKLHSTIVWSADSSTRSLLSRMEEEGEKENRLVRVNAPWVIRNSIIYYLRSGRFPYVRFHETPLRVSNAPSYDYFIHVRKEMPLVEYEPQERLVEKMPFELVDVKADVAFYKVSRP